MVGTCLDMANFANAQYTTLISIGTPPGEKATGFQFSCSVENGLYTPGAYELINGSCGLLHAVPEHPITCPAQTDYLPDASCPSDGAPATRPARPVLQKYASAQHLAAARSGRGGAVRSPPVTINQTRFCILASV